MANYKKQKSPFTNALRLRLMDYLHISDRPIAFVAKGTGINRTTLSMFINHNTGLSFEFGIALHNFLEGRDF